MNYIPRAIESTLKSAVDQFPAIVLTGPRQSGKTRLLSTLYAGTHRYANLDNPVTRQLAARDPRLFFEENKPPVIIDEIQYVPSLLSYIKIMIDRERAEKGQFLITGSQQFSLMQGVTESLAGRAAILNLLSMSWEESRQNSAKEHITPRELAEGLIRGGFPELVADPKIDSKLWYSSYLQTYLERDVRNIRQVGDLGEFQVFLQMIAARNGQILNMSEISKDIGVAVNTIKSWLSVLESSHQIVLVRPYFRNKGKRLIKSPKVYFVDTGLLCHLIGLGDPDHALKGPAAGSLFEAAVFGEMLRKFVNEGMPPRIYFWRTTSGDEIDFIVESPGALIPVEAKLTKTPTISLTRAIEDFSKLFPEARQGQIACLVDKRMTLSSHCSAIPLLQLTDILQEN